MKFPYSSNSPQLSVGGPNRIPDNPEPVNEEIPSWGGLVSVELLPLIIWLQLFLLLTVYRRRLQRKRLFDINWF